MHIFDRVGKWYNAPVLVGLVYLEIRRTLHQKYNLIAVEIAKSHHRVPAPHRYAVMNYCKQSQNVYDNGPTETSYAEDESFFGRNMEAQPQTNKVLSRSHSQLNLTNQAAFHL